MDKKDWYDTIVSSIVRTNEKLEELKAYEENRANGNITEAVLVCHPTVKHILKKCLFENKLKNIPIIATLLAEEDKIYMVTDKEVIEKVRRNSEEICDRDCANCDLLQDTDELLAMYKYVISSLEENKNEV